MPQPVAGDRQKMFVITQAPQAQNMWCMRQLVYIQLEGKFSYLKCVANLSLVPILKTF